VHPERRPLDSAAAPQAEVAGDSFPAQSSNRRRLRAETESTAGRVPERFHRPALDAAADLPRARRGRLRRGEPDPRKGDDRQCEEGNCEARAPRNPHMSIVDGSSGGQL
jgi:hypothetical protein